ncbi:MAG: type II secretion system protein [Pseudomonadota bacterium]
MQRGFNLLEVFFVIFIAAVFLIIAARLYSYYVWVGEKTQFKNSVAVLRHALNDYYYHHCNVDLPTQNVSYADVIAFIPGGFRTSIYNPWALNQADAFSFQIIKNADGIHMLKLTAVTRYSAANLVETVNATAAENGRLVWEWLPNQLIEKVENPLWIMSNNLQLYKNLSEENVQPNYCRV